MDQEAIRTVGVGSAYGSAAEAPALLCSCCVADSRSHRVHFNIHSTTHSTWQMTMNAELANII